MLCTEQDLPSAANDRFQLVPAKRFSLLLPILITVFLCASATAQVVSADFEDQTADGFTPFGGPTLTVSNVQANTGSFSLLTTNRTQTFMGPGMDVTKFLSAGQPYLFKVFVRLSDNTPSAGDTVRLTMKSIIGGSQTFNQVGVATVSNTGWTVLQGTYTPPASFSPPPNGSDNLFVYVEDDTNGNAEYYIDTFTISTVSGGCTNPPDNSGLFSDFEDGTLQGWSTRFNIPPR